MTTLRDLEEARARVSEAQTALYACQKRTLARAGLEKRMTEAYWAEIAAVWTVYDAAKVAATEVERSLVEELGKDAS